mmetsp:Transcript_4471/g.9389  ORF Transcript_4471/g.9389 Transcript_4471/m.9389 type:complete len:326 (-) Transcript_4471:177-1154(-)
MHLGSWMLRVSRPTTRFVSCATRLRHGTIQMSSHIGIGSTCRCRAISKGGGMGAFRIATFAAAAGSVVIIIIQARKERRRGWNGRISTGGYHGCRPRRRQGRSAGKGIGPWSSGKRVGTTTIGLRKKGGSVGVGGRRFSPVELILCGRIRDGRCGSLGWIARFSIVVVVGGGFPGRIRLVGFRVGRRRIVVGSFRRSIGLLLRRGTRFVSSHLGRRWRRRSSKNCTSGRCSFQRGFHYCCCHLTEPKKIGAVGSPQKKCLRTGGRERRLCYQFDPLDRLKLTDRVGETMEGFFLLKILESNNNDPKWIPLLSSPSSWSCSALFSL